jgi:hypothetical protein
MRISALALLLMSCVDKESEDTGPAADVCATVLLSADPAVNSTAAPLTVMPSVNLSVSDPSANLLLTTAEGTRVEGLFSLDGRILTFTPAAPLETATDYTAVATWCGGTASGVIPFTTTAGDLVGNTYRVPLGTMTYLGSNELVIGLIFPEPRDLLLKVTAQSTSLLDLRVAPTTTTLGMQDACLESHDWIGADFTADPRFVTVPHDYSPGTSEVNVPLSSMVIDATVMPGGVGLHKLRVTGDVDVREAATFFADVLGTGDPNALCGQLAGFGVSCQACVSDGSEYCIPLSSEEGSAVLEADTTVDCVRSEFCHPDCATSTCEDPSDGVCD